MMQTQAILPDVQPKRPKKFTGTILILSDNSWVRLPEGKDPDRYRKECEILLTLKQTAPTLH
jgi:hypothetical protein